MRGTEDENKTNCRHQTFGMKSI